MSYNDQLRQLADQFFEAHQEGGSARQILRWAYDNKLWEPHPDDFIRAGAEQLARAMRDDTETDPQGRTVRKKHVIVVERDGEQLPLWIDYNTATREQMELSFQTRRKLIVDDCVQLKNDVDSYNENRNAGEPIQIILNFTNDAEEAALVKAARSARKSVARVG